MKWATELLTAKKQPLQDFKSLYYHHTKGILINFSEICSWAMLRTHSAQTVHTQVPPMLVTEVRIQMLRCWDIGSDLNLSNSFIFASKIRASLQKWNYPDACVHKENIKLLYMLHYTQPQCELFEFSAKHNSKATLSRNQGMIVRRVL